MGVRGLPGQAADYECFRSGDLPRSDFVVPGQAEACPYPVSWALSVGKGQHVNLAFPRGTVHAKARRADTGEALEGAVICATEVDGIPMFTRDRSRDFRIHLPFTV